METAFGILEASEKYYRIKDDGHSAEYLIELVKTAQIWSVSSFWEYSYRKQRTSQTVDCVFGVIAGLCQTILNLGLSPDFATAVVIKLAALDDMLPEKNLEDLLTLINNVSKSFI